MAVQNAFHRRKSVGRQVFLSVFVATVILAFLMLSYIGFPLMENIPPHHVGMISTSGYAAPTAFNHNSRHYSSSQRPKVIREPNSCKRCGQIMLAGISTCPKCGWYRNH
jgi:hypothetical protein